MRILKGSLHTCNTAAKSLKGFIRNNSGVFQVFLGEKGLVFK